VAVGVEKGDTALKQLVRAASKMGAGISEPNLVPCQPTFTRFTCNCLSLDISNHKHSLSLFGLCLFLDVARLWPPMLPPPAALLTLLRWTWSSAIALVLPGCSVHWVVKSIRVSVSPSPS